MDIEIPHHVIHFITAVVEGGAGEVLAGIVIGTCGKALEKHHAHKRRSLAARKGAETKRRKKAAQQK